MSVDLSRAVEAAKASYGYPLDSTESADLHGAITAAFPLIVEALRVRAEADGDSAYEAWQRAELGTSGPDYDAQKASEDAYGAAAWLARIAQEAEGE